MLSKEHTLGPAVVFLVPFLVAVSAAVGLLTLQGKEALGLLAILAALGAGIIFVRPELGMLVFMVSFFVTYGRYLPTEGRLTPNNLLGLLFGVLLLVKIYRERDMWFLKERAVQIHLALAIYLFISSGIAEGTLGNPLPELDGTAEMRQSVTTRLAFFIFFINFLRTYRDVKLVTWTLLGLIVMTAVSGVQSSLEAISTRELRAAAEAGIAAAANPNRLAFFCVFGIGVLWYWRRAVQAKVVRFALGCSVPVLAVTALMTGSRSGVVNLAVVFVLIATEGRFSMKRQFQTAAVVGVAFYLAGHFLTATQIQRLQSVEPGSSQVLGSASSMEKRLKTLQAGWEMVSRNPVLGVGMGNFRWVHLQTTGSTVPAHNSYVKATAEGGFPTLFLYLALFWVTFKNFLQAERKTASPELREVARGLRTGFLTFLVFSAFADFWVNIIAYILVGLGIVVKRIQEQEVREPARGGLSARA